MADSFQNEVPKARINLKLDLHTGGASKKMELPLKLLVAGDFSNGQESAQISEREKVNITKNNFDSVLSEYSPKLNLTVKNTLSDDGGEENVQLTFQSMKDFTPEQVAAQIPVLLFIDEAHTIIGAGNQAGGADAANLLKPALARGELRTIAATTWSEYKQYFERDAALERRFQMVKVDEPDDDTACLMLRGLKSRYAEHRHYGLTTHIDESLYDALTAACLLPDTGARNVDSLLNQQILPVLSQQLLTHMAAKQKPHSLTLGWDDEEGIVLAFD